MRWPAHDRDRPNAENIISSKNGIKLLSLRHFARYNLQLQLELDFKQNLIDI